MKYAELVTIGEETALVKVVQAGRVDLLVRGTAGKKATTSLENRGSEWVVAEVSGASQADSQRLRDAISEAQRIALRRI